jgi:hypothetical protein
LLAVNKTVDPCIVTCPLAVNTAPGLRDCAPNFTYGHLHQIHLDTDEQPGMSDFSRKFEREIASLMVARSI